MPSVPSSCPKVSFNASGALGRKEQGFNSHEVTHTEENPSRQVNAQTSTLQGSGSSRISAHFSEAADGQQNCVAGAQSNTLAKKCLSGPVSFSGSLPTLSMSSHDHLSNKPPTSKSHLRLYLETPPRPCRLNCPQ